MNKHEFFDGAKSILGLFWTGGNRLERFVFRWTPGNRLEILRPEAVVKPAEKILEIVEQRLDGDPTTEKIEGNQRLHGEVRCHHDYASPRGFDQNKTQLFLDRSPHKIHAEIANRFLPLIYHGFGSFKFMSPPVKQGEKLQLFSIDARTSPLRFLSLWRRMIGDDIFLGACEDMQKLFFMCGSDVHAAGGVVRAINEANEQAKAAIKAAKGE